MNYWVIQEYKGNLHAIGPYKTEQAARNRFEKIQGGEIHEFRSDSVTASEVLREFRDEKLGSL